jgi:hypothetical protein
VSAAVRLERAGVAMRLVGHKTESIYRRYAIVSENDLREAVEKLGAATTAAAPARVHVRSSHTCDWNDAASGAGRPISI